MLLAFYYGHERFRWLEAAQDCLDLAVALSASSHLEARQDAVHQLRRVREIFSTLKKPASLSPVERELELRLENLLAAHVPPAVAESRTEGARSSELRVFPQTTGCVRSVVYAPDGTLLAVGGQDATVRLWNLKDGTSRILEGHKQPVQVLQFSPDNQRLASGAEDGTIILWDAASGKPLEKLAGHQHPILSLDFSPEGKTLLSAAGQWWGNAGEVRIWDLTNKVPGQPLAEFSHTVYFAKFTPDGKQVLVVSRGDPAKPQLQAAHWDLTSRKQIQSVPLPIQSVMGVNLSPDARQIVVSDMTGRVRILDVENGKSLAELKPDPSLGALAGVQHIFGLAFSPDGTKLITGGLTGKAFVWDWRRRQILREIDVRARPSVAPPFGPTAKMSPWARSTRWPMRSPATWFLRRLKMKSSCAIRIFGFCQMEFVAQNLARSCRSGPQIRQLRMGGWTKLTA